jgi:putative lipoic acid-binding regulatory protein
MTEEQETLLEFPCEFPIKAMGLTEHDIEGIVRSIVAQHARQEDASNLKQRASKGGKYVSVTVTIQAHSKQQIDNIYLALNARKEIVMVL